jgi:hypothetical protein
MAKHRYRRQFWARPQLYVLHRRYQNTPALKIAEQLGCSVARVYAKAYALGLSKNAAYYARPAAERRRPGTHIGGDTRFKTGHATWNKGAKGWDAGGRSHETRFKPGQRSNNWVPLGTLRINSEGFLDRKIADTRVTQRNWCPVHRLVWSQHRGPIPAKYLVAFKPGQHTTELALITIDRLELLTRAQLMERNTYHNYPKPIAQLIQLRGAVNRQIHKRERARP